MTPYLNPVTTDERVDYSTPGSSGYQVKPGITWNDPNNRKLRVITVGTGYSGIMMAYLIQKLCGNVEHVLYEKNADIGGTWLENKYPSCGCDVPSHAYTYSFALDPDWPRYFSFAQDILKYLHKVCNVFDLRKHMTFDTEVVGAYWDDETGEWIVKLREHKPGQPPREFEDRCHLFLYGAGLLNRYKFPDVPGLLDRFKGRVMHSSHWPDDYQKEQWANDRIAVIGSGSSSIQVVPGLQPHAKHLDVFVRTGIWFVEMAGHTGLNKEYDDEEKEKFRKDPRELVKHAKSIEDQVNGLWGAFFSDSELKILIEGMFGQRTAELIKDKRLLEGFTPKFGIGCRRVTPGDPYIHAVQEPNVDVNFTHLASCTEDGVVGADGVERKVDAIVCATGFDVSYRPHFPVVGKNGVDLRDKWEVCPESYLGLTVPDMPNFVMFIGPTWPVENGSVVGPLQSVGEYAIQMIQKLQNENIKSLTPKQDVTDMFNEHVQEWIKHTVWKDDCRAWYKDHDTGRVNAIWPGSSMHYQQVIQHPRYEDYEIERFDKNPWACLGMGWTVQNRKSPAQADCSPYINLNNLDPKWFAAVGGDEAELKKQVDESHTAKPLQGWVLGSSHIQNIKP